MTDHFNSKMDAASDIAPRTPADGTGLLPGDHLSDPIVRSIEDLSQDVGIFTRFRLRKVRGREAVRLAERALTEFMAAKRRAFAYQVGLMEDYVKKTMLGEAAQKTATIEREIAETIAAAASSFERLILLHEEAAYRAEIDAVRHADQLLADELIGERRYEQLLENAEISTDRIVGTVQVTARSIMENLKARFDRALQQQQ